MGIAFRRLRLPLCERVYIYNVWEGKECKPVIKGFAQDLEGEKQR